SDVCSSDLHCEVRPIARHRGHIGTCLEKLHRQLACSVGTEVEEDRRVRPRLKPGTATNWGRLDELIGYALLIATADGLDRIGRLLALALDDRVEGALGPLPALVAIHGVVPAGNGRDPALRELGEIVDGRVRRDVSTVGERVDPG